MKALLENWNKYLLNEISFEDAKKRLETKALTSWIKGMAFDEETKTMTLDPSQIETAKNELAALVLEFVPRDLTDNQKGMTLEWLISVGINDPLMKQKFYNVVTPIAAPVEDLPLDSARADLRPIRGDIERYWHSHEYSDQKDIFSIKSFADLAVAADRAKNKYDDAMKDKKFQDPEEGTEVFDGPHKNEWFIAALHTKAAACHHGKETDWCTAAPGLDYFESYYQEGDPMFFFKRISDGERWQFHFGSKQFMDEEDERVDRETFERLSALLMNTDAPKKYTTLIHEINFIKDTYVARDPSSSPEDLDRIARDEDNQSEDEMLGAVVRNPSTSPSTLVYMAGMTEYPYILQNIARKHNAPPEALTILSKDDDAELRWLVTEHPNTSPETLIVLSRDSDNDVRYSAIENLRMPPETLLALSKDSDVRVRLAVARHPRTPPEALLVLSKDPYRRIRNGAASNLDPDYEPQNISETKRRKLIVRIK